MSEARRRDAVVRMATDAAFAERVRTEPDAVAAELGLDDDDMAVLAALREDAATGSADLLDARLSKSSLFFGGGSGALFGAGTGFVCDGFHGGRADPVPLGGASLQCNLLPGGHAGFLCNLVPGDHAGILCNAAPPDAVAFACNGSLPGAAGIQRDGVVDTSFVCNGFLDKEMQGNAAPADLAGLQCNGVADRAPAIFCDVFTSAAPTEGSAPVEPAILCDVFAAAAPEGARGAGEAGLLCNGFTSADAAFACNGKAAADAVAPAGAASILCNGVVASSADSPKAVAPSAALQCNERVLGIAGGAAGLLCDALAPTAAPSPAGDLATASFRCNAVPSADLGAAGTASAEDAAL